MSPLIISVAAFVGVVCLILGLALLLRGDGHGRLEDRLAQLTGTGQASSRDKLLQEGLLAAPLEAAPGFIEAMLTRFGRLRLLFEQADTSLTPTRFFILTGVLAVVGMGVAGYAGFTPALIPILAAIMGSLPLFWLLWRRRKRLKAFGVQIPDALELIARALRAGHSLASGFRLVSEEMPAPIGTEFGRVFEEQNLGVPLEEALTNLADRIPNLDLKFFSTAVILQRQTGGDLAEILDKIGYLVRERFKIWGQVQALTAEGRLSGVVLLGLPPLLFVAVYRINPEYLMQLFTDPMGRQMLAGAVVLQILGALAIRKIVNIRV